ncbi:Hypothetical predicted protein [Olea europaea subsp. europaea]|uniref:Uncharacterized protein n=1 Tax=Olea europaea subsp. europaea TaxID=158383 RepID=A0A8S0S3G4_OLEEU|nr:Hypothetical predicted protein [Olea europaea subsp. europaea]
MVRPPRSLSSPQIGKSPPPKPPGIHPRPSHHHMDVIYNRQYPKSTTQLTTPYPPPSHHTSSITIDYNHPNAAAMGTQICYGNLKEVHGFITSNEKLNLIKLGLIHKNDKAGKLKRNDEVDMVLVVPNSLGFTAELPREFQREKEQKWPVNRRWTGMETRN